MGRIMAWAAGAALLLFGIATGLLGRFVRPTSDDYRLTVFTRDRGVAGIVEEFYFRLTGRVGNGLLAGIVYAKPEWGPRLLPSLMVGALALVLFLLLRNVADRAGCRPARLPLILAAGALTMIIFWGQPHPYQTLYWTAGIITHVIPPILLIALAARFFGPKGESPAFCAVAGLTVCFLTTVSEPVVPLCLVAAAALLVRDRRARELSALPFALVGGAGAGLALLQVTPGLAARIREKGSGMSPAVFGDAVEMSWTALGAYFSQPSFFAAVAVGLLAGLVLRPDARARCTPWPLLAALAVTYGIQCGVRYGFGPIPWIGYRIWLNFAFVWVLVLAWYGFCGSRWLRAGALVRTVAGGVVVAAAVSWGVAFLDVRRDMVVRAGAFDRQRARVEREVAAGRTVIGYRPLHIDALSEPFPAVPAAQDWITWSVAAYFGAPRLRQLR